MPRYRVYGHIVGIKYLGEFEGATDEDAIHQGLRGPTAHLPLCQQCGYFDVEIEEGSAEVIRESEKGTK